MKYLYPVFFFGILFLSTIEGLPFKEQWTAKRPPYENPELFEGDMLFPNSPIIEGRGVARRGASVPWTNGIVPYEISPGSYTSAQQTFIVDTMRKMERLIAINNVTCIRFRPRISTDPYYITITNGNGCSSYVGQNTGVTMARTVTLQHPGCLYEGIVMHEFLHTLGFFHEQSRPDRDTYVQVNYANIQTGMSHNFDRYDNTFVNTLNTPYDYGSVMHYQSTAFSSNGLPTIEPRTSGITIGQRNNMSAIDIAEVRILYNCSAFGITLPTFPPTPILNVSYINTTLSSSLTQQSSVYSRYMGSSGSRYYFEAFTVVTNRSATYIFGSSSSIDTFGYLYAGTFNPNSPISNIQTWDDDSGGNVQFQFSFYLQANSIYILVATTFSPTVVGSYSLYVSGPSLVSLRRMSVSSATFTPASSSGTSISSFTDVYTNAVNWLFGYVLLSQLMIIL